MPRLSIVIPHRRNDSRLEATLLSVLENRPSDCEVIVAHDGNYRDPYCLKDEVVFVEADQGSDSIQLINAGIMAACSPIVHTIIDGVIVRDGWTEAAVELLENDPELAAVAVPIQYKGRTKTYGVSTQAISVASTLRSGRIYATDEAQSAGPQMEAGFYRRRVMLALGGFDESLSQQTADVNLAWSLNELNLQVAAETEILVHYDSKSSRVDSLPAVQQLASLAVARGVAVGGLKNACIELVRGALSGKLNSSIAWAKGLLTVPRHSYAVRLAHAKEELNNRKEEVGQLKLYGGEAVRRRAA